jgi:hypothetical protein
MKFFHLIFGYPIVADLQLVAYLRLELPAVEGGCGCGHVNSFGYGQMACPNGLFVYSQIGLSMLIL